MDKETRDRLNGYFHKAVHWKTYLSLLSQQQSSPDTDPILNLEGLREWTAPITELDQLPPDAVFIDRRGGKQSRAISYRGIAGLVSGPVLYHLDPNFKIPPQVKLFGRKKQTTEDCSDSPEPNIRMSVHLFHYSTWPGDNKPKNTFCMDPRDKMFRLF